MLFWIILCFVLLAAIPAIICWVVVSFKTRQLSVDEGYNGAKFLKLGYKTRQTIDGVMGASVAAFIISVVIAAVFLVPVWVVHSASFRS